MDYTLNKKGKEVISALTMLGNWTIKYMKEENIIPECEECLSDMTKN